MRRWLLTFPLAVFALVVVAGCGRETKTTKPPKLGQQTLERKTGKVGERSWAINTENYLVVNEEAEVPLVLAAGIETDLPKEMNGRLWTYAADRADWFTTKDAEKSGLHYLVVPPPSFLPEEKKTNLPLTLILRWDLSAVAGKEAAPKKTWTVPWAGLANEIPQYNGKWHFKLYNVDDAHVDDLDGAITAPEVSALPLEEGPGLKVALAMKNRAFPAAQRLEAVATLEFSASEWLMSDVTDFATLKGPREGKALFDPEAISVGAVLYGPVAHAARTFESAGNAMFFPDLSRNESLLNHYRRWLRARYGTIETFNDYTEGGHKTFDKVGWHISTVPAPSPTGKPETYKEWETVTEAENTMKVQADFVTELRAKNVNRALQWLKERHPQTPVFAVFMGQSTGAFVERAAVAGDGVVFWLPDKSEVSRRTARYAQLVEDAKIRAGSTKFMGAWLGPESYAAMTSASAAVALGESGFRGLFITADKDQPTPKTLQDFADAVETTLVAEALQEPVPGVDGEKAAASLKAREEREGPAPFPPPGASPSATVTPSQSLPADVPPRTQRPTSPQATPPSRPRTVSPSQPTVPTPVQPTPPAKPTVPEVPNRDDGQTTTEKEDWSL